MLDAELLEQLRSLFAQLESDITLAIAPSEHPKQAELAAFLESVASTSDHLDVVEHGPLTREVRFELLKNGSPLGVRFRGIPGGHEFTSLVLAILNGDGKGRLPDSSLQARIRALRGPIDLRTYVSLSCTNCPDVVQALNLMAILHGDFRHETVDGDLAHDEVARLGIQGVPTVIVDDQIFHVGKSTLAELWEKLEDRFGTETSPAQGTDAKSQQHFDVVVIGGGPAGISAAIYCARKGLSTAIVAERFGGQVKDTLGIENLISVPYTEGPKLAAALTEHLQRYPVVRFEHRKVETILATGIEKQVRLKNAEVLTADAVVVATGAQWRKLGIVGEEAYLGRGVAFCPHCDGPFYRGKPVAVIGGGNSGVEAAIDLARICQHVTLIEFAEQLKADEVLVNHLRTLANVTIVCNCRPLEIVGDGTKLTRLRGQDRATEEPKDFDVDGVFVQIGLVPNSAVVRGIVDTNRFGEIVVDAHNRTSKAGVYAAGDVTTVPYKQIVIAMGEGAKAALTVFEDRVRRQAD